MRYYQYNIMPRVSPTSFLALTLFLGVFILYLYTSPPGATQYADSSELITASYLLGIPHPPCYPLFVLIGKLFSFIPFGEIAWRYSVMTSLLGSLTVVLVYLILVRILSQRQEKNKKVDSSWQIVDRGAHGASLANQQAEESKTLSTIYYSLSTHIPALTGALSLAFSYIFWLYSIVPEVWAFNSFFTAFLLYLGVRWYEHAQRRIAVDREEQIVDRVVSGTSVENSPSIDS